MFRLWNHRKKKHNLGARVTFSVFLVLHYPNSLSLCTNIYYLFVFVPSLKICLWPNGDPVDCKLLLFSCSIVSDSLPPHARLPCPSPSPRVCSNSCPLSQWCHPTISSSVVSFSSCLQSFPASGSFPMSRLFASRGQTIGASASNEYSWLNPLGLTGLISLQFKGLSRDLQHHSSKASILWPLAFFIVCKLEYHFLSTVDFLLTQCNSAFVYQSTS